MAWLRNAQIVYNNDDRPWRFIGAKITGPGMGETIGVWAVGTAGLIVAADRFAMEFSVWQLPAGGAGFASQFDDEIEVARACAGQ